MKRFALIVLALLMVLSFVYAEIEASGPAKRPIDTPRGKVVETSRAAPNYYFSRAPLPIMTNYYDYMIGSYSSIPLRVIPAEFGGGYFMTYQGRRESGGTRRVYYTLLSEAGDVINNNEISNVQKHEGFPTMVLDRESGKPLYAWHVDLEDGSGMKVMFTSDAYMAGYPGLFNQEQIIADNPTTITAPNGIITKDNEFIWPTAVIGPSPFPGKRRVYVSMRNSVSHALNGSPSENPLIAWADIDREMIESGTLPTWHHTTVPLYDQWNVDTEYLRRPYTTICADHAGYLYYIGYNVTLDADSNDLDEPDVHVLRCGAYGEGTWTTHTFSSHIPTWNPPSSPTDDTPYFKNDDGVPYEPGDLRWSIINSGHVNAVVDGWGHLHFPAIWGLTTNENTYYPAMQYVKQLIFKPESAEFEIREVFPKKDAQNDADYGCYHPWDNEAPWGVPEYIESEGEYYLDIHSIWPFPHWDQSAHEGLMMFHYNHIKMSKPNSDGLAVLVWQDSNKARMHNEFNDPDYADYANTPEIMIAASRDNGVNWSEPICLNNQINPELANIIPMWVYPADEVISLGEQDGRLLGKIGFMLFDDYTWGSHANQPPYHSINDGGQTMFMELVIDFTDLVGNDDQTAAAPALNLLKGNSPTPFNPTTTISYSLPASGNVKLGVYNLRGQLVRTLVNEAKSAGDHRVVWDGKDERGNTMSSGIYFYRLDTGKHSETRKMMLMK